MKPVSIYCIVHLWFLARKQRHTSRSSLFHVMQNAASVWTELTFVQIIGTTFVSWHLTIEIATRDVLFHNWSSICILWTNSNCCCYESIIASGHLRALCVHRKIERKLLKAGAIVLSRCLRKNIILVNCPRGVWQISTVNRSTEHFYFGYFWNDPLGSKRIKRYN